MSDTVLNNQNTAVNRMDKLKELSYSCERVTGTVAEWSGGASRKKGHYSYDPKFEKGSSWSCHVLFRVFKNMQANQIAGAKTWREERAWGLWRMGERSLWRE